MSERVPGRGAKPELAPRMYWAYDKNGHNKGQVRLTRARKERYEAQGFTFKECHR